MHIVARKFCHFTIPEFARCGLANCTRGHLLAGCHWKRPQLPPNAADAVHDEMYRPCRCRTLPDATHCGCNWTLASTLCFIMPTVLNALHLGRLCRYGRVRLE